MNEQSYKDDDKSDVGCIAYVCMYGMSIAYYAVKIPFFYLLIDSVRGTQMLDMPYTLV